MPLHVSLRILDVNGRKKTKPDDLSPGFLRISRSFGLNRTVSDVQMVPKGRLCTLGPHLKR